jgi:hypothetical protein
MKELVGRWKYSKKREAWIWKWKRRKVKPLAPGDTHESA